MNTWINYYVALPYYGRTAIFLLMVMIVFGIVSKPVCWLASGIPFVLHKIFLLCYQLLEFLVSILHKRLGSYFFKISNHISSLAEKIDYYFRAWYKHWHNGYKVHWKRNIAICLIAYLYILLPAYTGVEEGIVCFARDKYLIGEQICVDWLQNNAISVEENNAFTMTQEAKADDDIQEIELVVFGLTSSLLVRDIPDMKQGNALDKLYNDDVVIWKGELTFAEAENQHVEAWVKIVTQNGVEGWSRLFFLRPKDDGEIIFHLGS